MIYKSWWLFKIRYRSISLFWENFMDTKEILVGGKIPFLLSDTPANSEKNEKKHAINELAAYLHCFLDGNVYLNDLKKTRRVIRNMLTEATLMNDALCFSFPKDITSRFFLEDCYTIPLKRGAAFKFYNEMLKKQSRLACDIVVRDDVPLHNSIITMLQRIILKSKKYPKKITIGRNKQTKQYNFRITFAKNISMIRDSAESIDDVITRVERHLLI